MLELTCFLDMWLADSNLLEDEEDFQMENEKSAGNKYTVKDAAIIGIFCAIMFVVFMAYSILTGVSRKRSIKGRLLNQLQNCNTAILRVF